MKITNNPNPHGNPKLVASQIDMIAQDVTHKKMLEQGYPLSPGSESNSAWYARRDAIFADVLCEIASHDGDSNQLSKADARFALEQYKLAANNIAPDASRLPSFQNLHSYFSERYNDYPTTKTALQNLAQEFLNTANALPDGLDIRQENCSEHL